VNPSRPLVVFEISRIPVIIQPMAVVMLLVFGLIWVGQGVSLAKVGSVIVFMVVALVSIIGHELGHALMARGLGMGVRQITVHGMGGTCQYQRAGSPARMLAASLAGPGAGFLLALLGFIPLFFLGSHLPSALLEVLATVLSINLVWSIFNLVPLSRLDGGHALGHLLRMRLRPDQVRKISTGVSIGAGALLCLYGLSRGQGFMVAFGGYSIYNDVQELRA